MVEKREEGTNAPSAQRFVDHRTPSSHGESVFSAVARASSQPPLPTPAIRQATIPLQYPSRARGRRDYALLIRTGTRVRAGQRGVRERDDEGEEVFRVVQGRRCALFVRQGCRDNDIPALTLSLSSCSFYIYQCNALCSNSQQNKSPYVSHCHLPDETDEVTLSECMYLLITVCF